jgi:hypothetical protein
MNNQLLQERDKKLHAIKLRKGSLDCSVYFLSQASAKIKACLV